MLLGFNLKISKKTLTFGLPIALAILVMAVYLLTQPVQTTNNSGTIVKAPDFSYTFLNGKKVSLSDYLGKKPIILNFWAPWWDVCKSEAPGLARAAKLNEGKIQFLGVVVEGTDKGAREFVANFKLPYPSGLDSSGKIANTYKVTGVPETFFINGDGEVIAHWIGGLNDETLTKYLNQLK